MKILLALLFTVLSSCQIFDIKNSPKLSDDSDLKGHAGHPAFFGSKPNTRGSSYQLLETVRAGRLLRIDIKNQGLRGRVGVKPPCDISARKNSNALTPLPIKSLGGVLRRVAKAPEFEGKIYPRVFWDEALALAQAPYRSLDEVSLEAVYAAAVDESLSKSPATESSIDQNAWNKGFTQALIKKSPQNNHVESLPIKSLGSATYVAVESLLEDRVTLYEGFGVNFGVTPLDLLKSATAFCERDLCQVNLERAFSTEMHLPLGFKSSIDMVFTRSADAGTSSLTYDWKIDGTFTPISFGELLAVKVSVGVDAQYKSEEKRFILANPRCGLTATCNLPLLKINGKISQEGLSFESDLTLGPSSYMTKLFPFPTKVSKNIEFKEFDTLLKSLNQVSSSTKMLFSSPLGHKKI